MIEQELKTPMMIQYWEIKKKHPNEIVLFRLGDFYEVFFDDAVIASRELDITLTKRNKNSNIYMAGIPYHAVEPYIAKLVKKGYSVVICDQVGEVQKAQLVKREITKIITPGTITEEFIADPKSDVELVSIHFLNENFGLSKINISTGDFCIYSFDSLDNLILELDKIEPAEIILSERFPFKSILDENRIIKTVSADFFNLQQAKELLKNYRILPKEIEEENKLQSAISASASVINYILETQRSYIPYIKQITLNNDKDFLKIDWATKKNLDLLKSSYDGNENNSLYKVLDNTETPMGARLLKRTIKNPIINRDELNKRFNIIESFVTNKTVNLTIKEKLSEIYDIERIITRISIKTARPRDLSNLRNSLKNIPAIKEVLYSLNTTTLTNLANTFTDNSELISLLDNSIIEEPPLLIKDGGVIKAGFNADLDDLRKLNENAWEFILDIEKREQEKNNMPNLRIDYNRVSGYYIEIPKGQSKNAPEHFIRKQTLKNNERYTTPELMEFENKAVTSKVRALSKEKEIYEELIISLSKYITDLKNNADLLSFIDLLACFAQNAQKYQLTRPVFQDMFSIKNGRHMIIEAISKKPFTPNDLDMSNRDMLMITGPNMGGKSTFMRQNALIIIMAHLGCFVPAEQCILPEIDRIFSRIGASDNLSEGVSTFMMEMQETSNILKYATSKSFVIIDEIGRGTSTFDGLSLAWAIAEDLIKKRCKTLFSTHYFEMIELEKDFDSVLNVHLDSDMIEGEITFLHKVKEGSVDQSYGLHVAKLAGLERDLLNRAESKLTQLKNSHSVDIKSYLNNVIQKDINSLTPLEALNILSNLLK